MARPANITPPPPLPTHTEAVELENDWSVFRQDLAEANLLRMWWLLIGSTTLSIALALFDFTKTGPQGFADWQSFDIGGSLVFLFLFWRARKGRFSLRFRWWLGPAYFAFWLALMDGYYFQALPVYGETSTFALGAITPAVLILLPPRIFVTLLLWNYAVFCSLLLGGHSLEHGRSYEQILGSFFNGSLGILIAALAAWFLYQARLTNFRRERHIEHQEELARLAEARGRAILENIPFQAWLKDRQSRFLAVNQEFLRGHNLPEEAIIQKSVDDVYGPERGRQYRAEEEEIIRTGRKAHFEQMVQGPEGVRWYEVFKHPVCDPEGLVTGVAGLARDITPRKEIEARLLAADRAKSEFLAAMSHEIRTPMNSVLGYARLLEGLIGDSRQREYLSCITESGELLLTIINDILDLSRIEAGTLSLEREPLNLANLIDQVRRMFEPIASDKGLDFRFVVERDVPERIVGDAARIKQILVNLVSNAVKFTERGYVAVRVSFQPGSTAGSGQLLLLEIQDTGIGIAPENIERLFQPFCQIDTAIARRFGGTGLGLIIAQNLARNMGGHIEVVSEKGKGSTFRVRVAAEVPSETDAVKENSEVPDEDIDLTGRNVLVVEDNRSNRGLVAAILRRWGLRVSLVASGREAIEAIREQPYDAILMDVQMPDMDGFETTRRIREWEQAHSAQRKSPIIACTALAMKGDESRCLEAGMDDYVIKPLNVAKLRRALGRAIPR